MLIPLIYLLAAAAVTPASSVSLVNPVENQLPLIARIGQDYSWSFSQATFNSSSANSLIYTASNLPDWLTFDASSRSFQGTPAASDEGNPEITVTAKDSSSSASSTFTLCVTPYSAPEEKIPIGSQFYQNNPSLSSVFMIEQTSALATSNPALRVPPGWSFSIGFEGDTFVSANSIYYEALQADGSPLPSWIAFNPDSVTFNGLAPHASEIVSPLTLSFALHGSDQKGYTASSLPFDLVVTLHDLSASQDSLPTINITAATPFNLSLSSPADFSGIFIDEQSIQPSNISKLSIDTSQYHAWLQYDESSMTLSGQPPSSLDDEGPGPILPVILTASFNQTLHTNISLAVVPSYFSASTLDPVIVDPGQDYSFDLTQHLSNATLLGHDPNDINLSAGFDPSEAASYLTFDSSTAQLTGIVPFGSNIDYSHLTVTFTAYSRITHSTSHASLMISIATSHASEGGGGKPAHSTNLSVAARKRLILGLGIVFGSIGGIIVIALLLTLMRRGMRVKDTALLGEEGANAWTEKEKKYYGIGIDVEKIARDLVVGHREGYVNHLAGDGSDVSEKGSLEAAPIAGAEASSMTNENPFEPVVPQREVPTGAYGALGLGLGRVAPRGHPGLPGMMSKGEFMGKIKETARNVSDKVRKVSDKYTRIKSRRLRPIIGRPVLALPEQSVDRLSVTGLPSNNEPGPSRHIVRDNSFPFSDFEGSRGTSLVDSPTSSSGARSIPVRRADFASPKPGRLPPMPAPARILGRSGSASSLGTHAGEAVLHIASRAASIRSVNSASGVSYQSQPEKSHNLAERPRVVQFKDSARVPVPKLPSGQGLAGNQIHRPINRIVSQTAAIVDGKRPVSVDGMNLGMHYVNTLGGNSMSSELDIEVLQWVVDGKGNTKVELVPGKEFKIQVKIPSGISEKCELEAKLISGNPLPSFMQLDAQGSNSGDSSGRVVEIYGIPHSGEVGEYSVGVYIVGKSTRVAKVLVKVVEA